MKHLAAYGEKHGRDDAGGNTEQGGNYRGTSKKETREQSAWQLGDMLAEIDLSERRLFLEMIRVAREGRGMFGMLRRVRLRLSPQRIRRRRLF